MQHGRLPHPRNEADTVILLTLAKELDTEIDENIVKELAYQATGDLSPINAVMGSFVAQEVLKACSAKFHPMVQHMHFDLLK